MLNYLNTIFNQTALDTTLTVQSILISLLVSFAIGMFIAFTYMKTHRGTSYSQNFTLTLLIIPSIIAIIITLVGSDLARAFSLAGAFSIIRFRSAPGDPKDIAYVFFALAVGLAVGVGLPLYAVLFALVFCGFMFIIQAVDFGRKKDVEKTLKITIPEDLDYEGVFDDILEKYTTKYQLMKVKTTDLGSLFELVYAIRFKSGENEKEFIDELRCRNGNLNITLSLAGENAYYA